MSGKFQTINRDTAYLLPPSLQDGEHKNVGGILSRVAPGFECFHKIHSVKVICNRGRGSCLPTFLCSP